VNIPVVCAGALVNQGNVVIADADGIVVVRAAMEQQVADAAEARESFAADRLTDYRESLLGLQARV